MITRLKLLFLLQLSFLICNAQVKDFSYDGIYESIIKTGKGKKLVHLYVYRSKYKDRRYTPFFNRDLKRDIYSYQAFILIKIYPNKKGIGEPEETYFNGRSFETKEGLRITDFTNKSYELSIPNTLIKGFQRKYEFILPKINREPKFVNILGIYQGEFYRKSSFNTIPKDFYNSLGYALKVRANKYDSAITFGYKPIALKTFKYTEGRIPILSDTLEAYFKYSLPSEHNLDRNYIARAKLSLENSLKFGQFNKDYIFSYLPKTYAIKFYISPDNNYSSTDSLHYFTVHIEKDSLAGIRFNIYLTDVAKDIEKEGFRISEAKRAEKARKKAIEEEKERQRLEKELVRITNIMAIETETGEPTELQMRTACELYFQAAIDLYKGYADNKVDRNNPLSALLNLTGRGMQGTSYDILHFKKITCKNGQKEPGFVCDYQMAVKLKGGLAGRFYGNLTGNTEYRVARFQKVDGLWRVIMLDN